MANQQLVKKRGNNWVIVLVYIILGVYFINHPLNFFQVPAFILKFDSWIIFVGGLFMFFGLINYFKAKRER